MDSEASLPPQSAEVHQYEIPTGSNPQPYQLADARVRAVPIATRVVTQATERSWTPPFDADAVLHVEDFVEHFTAG
jgi:hypothetical protein